MPKTWPRGRAVRGVRVYETGDVEIELAGWLYPDCPPHLVRDHIDGNALDNRRQNIAFVTRSANALNNWKRRDGGRIPEDTKSKVIAFRVPLSAYDSLRTKLDEVAGGRRYGVYSVVADALGVSE